MLFVMPKIHALIEKNIFLNILLPMEEILIKDRQTYFLQQNAIITKLKRKFQFFFGANHTPNKYLLGRRRLGFCGVSIGSFIFMALHYCVASWHISDSLRSASTVSITQKNSFLFQTIKLSLSLMIAKQIR
jgi:hypothetical protein